jgi:hypothetical protein
MKGEGTVGSRKGLPRALLLVAAAVAAVAAGVVVVVVLRGRSGVPEPTSGFSPAPGSSREAGAPPPSQPLSDVELRDFRVRIGHEECESGARRVNTLEGREATDPKAGPLISVCLRYGNVAWYKCVLRADSGDKAVACNHRLLNPDGPAP